ncbi:hypothetical protein MGYG_08218 [Nannizzia gypsea CBS 118893]|uniref:Uncharacterized protein n=1 Tax=Arthroderma gypseum (strain ATCC MYA-4604 / CBS 118893) TaxID=535722 RepID=E4V5D0_ARTGP|nr:hypothetical protein MGYG_08218 [Nannizzia gypsea CBS 118893]EFR05204.1 hypothetical protein MGYG_08218 [Nannizzia gypsea CBS 118893]
MQFTLFTIVILAFVANTYAQYESYYIRNEPLGLNVTSDDDGYVYMENGTLKYTSHAWNIYPVASDIKNWAVFEKHYGYIRFFTDSDGGVSDLGEARLYEIEKVGDYSYVIDLQSINERRQTLAWTVEKNSTDPRTYLKLRPYKRLPSQRFTITPIN